MTGVQLIPDHGLHGAGWHIQPTGGKLNVHLDYSIHPKLGLERRFNFIFYLTPNWNTSWGGNLEMWSHDTETNQPKELVKTVENKFNRVVIFDTSYNSWHGFSQPINCPEDVYRKSIAMYYLCEPSENADKRGRALFAPTEEQKNDPEIMKLIEQRVK
jgi:Rps23 Pro-64 3,4-dihydroxylase Tpa1-like proline 4-hydroxylase